MNRETCFTFLMTASLLNCRPLALYVPFQMYTDSFFLWAADEAVRIQMSTNMLKGGGTSIYYYYFAYRGPHSFSKLFGDSTRDFGECAAKEAFFHMSYFSGLFNSSCYSCTCILFSRLFLLK